MRDDQSYESYDSAECHTECGEHGCQNEHYPVELLSIQTHLHRLILTQEHKVEFLCPDEGHQ